MKNAQERKALAALIRYHRRRGDEVRQFRRGTNRRPVPCGFRLMPSGIAWVKERDPILKTTEGRAVYSSGVSFSLSPEGSDATPVTARPEYGALNNRATKRRAEKSLNQSLVWA